MYQKCLLIFPLLAILLVGDSLALSCLPCYMLKCPEDRSCPGGKVKGICGCCTVCAKVKDELCGGPYNFHGVCDQGLVCAKSGRSNFNSVGVCRELNETPKGIGYPPGIRDDKKETFEINY